MRPSKSTKDMDDVVVYSEGLCFLSACSVLDADETRRQLPHPGVAGGWQMHDGPFHTGEPNGVQCPDHPGRRHWLFSC